MDVYQHVDLDIAQICNKPNYVRVAQVLTDRFVEYPAVEKVMAKVSVLATQQKRMRVTGVVARGDPGSGKTALIEAIERLHCQKKGRRLHRPVLVISMTGATKAIEIYKRTIEALGASVPQTIKSPEDWARHAIRLLVHYNVRILCIDELSDVLKTTVLQQRDTLTAIKYIMNEARIPVFALGTEIAATAMKEDPHLAQRFSEYEIPNWEANLECRGLLANIEKRIPLQKPSHLDGPGLTGLIVKLGHGRLREMAELINTGAILAMTDGTERITREILKRVAEGEGPQWELIDAARDYKESTEGKWLND